MEANQFGNSGWTPDRIHNLSGKTFIITGTTSGTGFEAAKTLLSKGATVVMLNRNPKKAENTIAKLSQDLGNDIDVSNVQIDLSKQGSVKKAAEKVLKVVPQIDALICNAAIALVPKQILSEDGWELQMATNYYGHWTLQGLLFPLIEKSNGRITTVGSMGYKLGMKTIKFDDLTWDNDYKPNAVYCHSKLAQMMSTYELQDRLKKVGKSNVSTYVCHPGASRTSLVDNTANKRTRFIWQIMKRAPMVQSAEKGAYPQLMCATEPNLDPSGFYGPTKRMNTVGPVGEHKLEPHAKDKAIAKRLWEVSEEETRIEWNI